MDKRVGYATIDLLASELEGYIRACTVNHVFVGDLHYLMVYKSFKDYLSVKNGGEDFGCECEDD